jgi:hypothetical protein
MTVRTSITVRVPLTIRHRPGRKAVAMPAQEGRGSETVIKVPRSASLPGKACSRLRLGHGALALALQRGGINRLACASYSP